MLSEQNLHFAAPVSDRAYVIEKGRIRYEGTMAALREDEEVRRTYLSFDRSLIGTFADGSFVAVV